MSATFLLTYQKKKHVRIHGTDDKYFSLYAGTPKVDEDHLSRRAQDQSRSRHRDDPAGEDVREKQDGGHHLRDGPPQLLGLHLPVVGVSVHPPQSPQG